MLLLPVLIPSIAVASTDDCVWRRKSCLLRSQRIADDGPVARRTARTRGTSADTYDPVELPDDESPSECRVATVLDPRQILRHACGAAAWLSPTKSPNTGYCPRQADDSCSCSDFARARS
jgi:hypothetical protein